MRRFVGALMVMTLVLAGCGNSTSDTGGGGGGGGGGGAVAGGTDLPAASTVIFGTAYDPTALTVTGKTTTLKQGQPMVAVGRAFTPRPATEIVVGVGSGSTNFPARPVSASNDPSNADLFAFDLTPDKLGPGTWVVSFTTPAGKIIASGFLTVTP